MTIINTENRLQRPEHSAAKQGSEVTFGSVAREVASTGIRGGVVLVDAFLNQS